MFQRGGWALKGVDTRWCANKDVGPRNGGLGGPTLIGEGNECQLGDKISNHYKGSKIWITLLIEYLKVRTLFEIRITSQARLAWMILVNQISQRKNERWSVLYDWCLLVHITGLEWGRLWDLTSVGRENETLFTRVWKPFISRRVLKALKRSSGGKAQKGQYLLAVSGGLGRAVKERKKEKKIKGLLIFLLLEMNETRFESLNSIIAWLGCFSATLQFSCYLLHLWCCFCFQISLLSTPTTNIFFYQIIYIHFLKNIMYIPLKVCTWGASPRPQWLPHMNHSPCLLSTNKEFAKKG